MEETLIQKRPEVASLLEKKVSENKGSPALTLREITTGYSENYGHPREGLFYIETGLISGDMIHNDIDFSKSFNKLQTIEATVGFDLFHAKHYSFFSTYEIPVKKKLVSHGPIPSLDFQIDELKNAKDGFLGFETSEICPLNLEGIYPGYSKDFPYLEKIDILIGKEEISHFFRGHQKNEIDEYFELFEEGVIEKIIEGYDQNVRENISRQLAQSMSQLCIFRQGLMNIENKVKRITYSRIREQDGSYIKCNDTETDMLYSSLRASIYSELKSINTLLEKSRQINLIKLGTIDGKCIGFPVNIPVENYLDYIVKETTEIASTMKNLNSYLSEQMSKA